MGWRGETGGGGDRGRGRQGEGETGGGGDRGRGQGRQGEGRDRVQRGERGLFAEKKVLSFFIHFLINVNELTRDNNYHSSEGRVISQAVSTFYFHSRFVYERPFFALACAHWFRFCLMISKGWFSLATES